MVAAAAWSKIRVPPLLVMVPPPRSPLPPKPTCKTAPLFRTVGPLLLLTVSIMVTAGPLRVMPAAPEIWPEPLKV